jgi:hypothetical protein
MFKQCASVAEKGSDAIQILIPNDRDGQPPYNKLPKKNSVALVRKRTIPIERPPLVGEVTANFSR